MVESPQNILHRKISRRRWLGYGLIGTPLLLAANAIALEPNWLKVKQVKLAEGTPTHRLVHFTDVHYRGNREQLEDIVARINALSPDFVCFTGDLIEDTAYLPEALEILRGIQSPLYGVPGNHDYWAEPEWGLFHEAFAATGGAWLMEETALTKDGKDFTIHVYDGVNHAFNNDTSAARYDKAAANLAWSRTLGLFREALGS